MFTLRRPRPPTKLFHTYVVTLPRLDGKTFVITGSTSGTGQVLARSCGRLGARVLVLNRPSARAVRAHRELLDEGVVAVAVDCDLQSFEAVREAASEVAQLCPDGVDVLVNNAGVMGLDDLATDDGCDVQMQTNHLGHFLLTSAIWPLLCRAADAHGESRIVNHSSGARLGAPLQPRYLQKNGGKLGGDSWPGLGRWQRYRQSKLANLLFTYALHDRVVADVPQYAGRVKSVCAHPGPTDSGLQHKAVDAGGRGLIDRYLLWRTLSAAQSVEDGTLGLARAACEPGVKSGAFYGPTRKARVGMAELLPPERDLEGERVLWTESLRTTGIEDFFGT